MRTRTKIIALLLLLLAATIIGWPGLQHYRLKNKVAAYRRQLIAQGEKLTIAELTPRPPLDRDNGAANLVRAVWRTGNKSPSNQPPIMRVVLPGRAMVAWQQPVLRDWDSTNVWPGLRNELQDKGDALAEMRAALEFPTLASAVDYSQGFTMPMRSLLVPVKRAVQWLSAATLLELRERRVTNAVENIRAMSALVSHYKEEPLIIEYLVRIAVSAIAVNTVWEALQSSDLDETQLAGLQRQWEGIDFLSHLEAALSMERTMGEKAFAEMRASPQSAMGPYGPMGGAGTSTSGLAELMELGQGVLESPTQGVKELFRRYPGYWSWKWWWSYEDELAQMQFQQADLVAVREVRKERCFQPALNRCEQANEALRKAHPKAGVRSDYDTSSTYFHCVTRLRDVEMQRHLLVAAIALKRFHLRHGHYPNSLAALVPEFCQETPRDPIDGQPLRYRLQADGSYLLYSSGENGVDDGGDPSRPPESSDQRRLNWLKGRDVVWPQSASPQEAMLYDLEIEAERDKQEIHSRVVVTNGMTPAMLVEMERLAQTYHFTLTNNSAKQP